jgi:AcrR family transcriptional regulator
MPAGTSKKSRNTEKRRKQILKAALEVFTQKGYAAATMPEIAQAAGVAAGTIYLYYPSKRELFVAVIKDMIITESLIKLIDKIPKGNFESVLKNIMKNRLDIIKNPVFVRIPTLMGEILRDPELKKIWQQGFLQPFLGRIELGSRMMSEDKFREIEPAIAVRAVGGMILGFLMLRVMEGDTSPLNKIKQEKIVEDIVNIILHGLLKEKENVR